MSNSFQVLQVFCNRHGHLTPNGFDKQIIWNSSVLTVKTLLCLYSLIHRAFEEHLLFVKHKMGKTWSLCSRNMSLTHIRKHPWTQCLPMLTDVCFSIHVQAAAHRSKVNLASRSKLSYSYHYLGLNSFTLSPLSFPFDIAFSLLLGCCWDVWKCFS